MNGNNIRMNFILWFVGGLIIVSVLALGVPLLVSPDRARFINAELTMAIAIVLTVTVLMALLFAFVNAFSTLGLANKDQALGLPEGSIRAVIALVLIMVFIILDIYMFRIVGQGTEGVAIVKSPGEITALGPRAEILNTEQLSDSEWAISFRRPIDEEGTRLAQQVVTTVGTLVVAVAGFYFGSATVAGAAAAVRGEKVAVPGLAPVIVDFEPKSGQQGATIPMKVQGRRLRDVRTVRLVRGDSTMVNVGDVTSSETEASCNIVLNGTPGGEKWDVVVESQTGSIDVWPEAFTLTT